MTISGCGRFLDNANDDNSVRCYVLSVHKVVLEVRFCVHTFFVLEVHRGGVTLIDL